LTDVAASIPKKRDSARRRRIFMMTGRPFLLFAQFLLRV
jgi:hypothetical protein